MDPSPESTPSPASAVSVTGPSGRPSTPLPSGLASDPGHHSGPLASQGVTRTLALHFTGSGSEYFRIWLVNLLLTLVTLGIYYPWARVRRLQYFASNTWIGNDDFGRFPLEFTGNPARMLRGYGVMVVLLLVYLVAGNLSPVIGSLAFLALLAMLPVLTWAGLRFRLGNTRWRGLQFSFAGTMAGAYRAYLPLLVALGGSTLLVSTVAALPGDLEDPVSVAGFLEFASIGLTLIGGLAWIWCLYLLVCYRQNHLRFGVLQTRLDLGFGSYAWMLARAVGLSILLTLVLVPALVLVFWLAGALSSVLHSSRPGDPAFNAAVLALLLPMIFFLALGWQIFVRSWLVAREQNLVWSRTRGPKIRFDSRLSARAYIGRNLLNWFLIIVTLGLYQPFAAIALARLRLDAMSIDTEGDPATIMATAEAAPGVAGDAGADVFGVDIGL